MKLLSSQTTTKETKKFQLFSDFPNINLEVISENNKIKNAKLKGKGILTVQENLQKISNN